MNRDAIIIETREPILRGNNTYLSMGDAKRIYEFLNYNSKKGITAFVEDAKQIASRTENRAYIFKNEEALFKLYQKHLPEQLSRRGIDSFGQLMQLVS